MKWYIYFVFLLTALLLFDDFVLRGELDNTVSNLEEKTTQLENTNQNINSLNSELDQTNEELNQIIGTLIETKNDLNNTQKELEDANTQLHNLGDLLEETKQKFVDIRDEISNMETSIDESIQWFKENAYLPPSLKSFISRAKAKCIDSGTLNLACVPYVMELKLDFIYKYEYPDKLYSIETMVDNKGGDCEDYSLFLKAYLNTLKITYNSMKLEAWSPGTDQYIIYEEDNTFWYHSGSKKFIGNLNELYPYSICFTTYYNGSRFEGHCIVALAEKEIDSIEDIGNLNNALAFEPQDGRYKGVVGTDYGICAEGNEDCIYSIESISIIITDSDLFEFSEGEWRSYGLQKDNAGLLDDEIKKILGKFR